VVVVPAVVVVVVVPGAVVVVEDAGSLGASLVVLVVAGGMVVEVVDTTLVEAVDEPASSDTESPQPTSTDPASSMKVRAEVPGRSLLRLGPPADVLLGGVMSLPIIRQAPVRRSR
jgi:hypothetical protein